MSKIVSIGTEVPRFKYEQEDILLFMQQFYALDEVETRKLRFLYRQSGIKHRHSVVGDYCRPMNEWKFYPHSENIEPFPSLEQRMEWYQKHAAPLSVGAIRKCLDHRVRAGDITHLITVSCTGMSAPGLDLQLMELLDLPRNIFRTSVNFMGCYAAIHALKIADAFCKSDRTSKVLVVCTELCSLHLQKENTMDNLASGLLFSDGAAAALVVGDDDPAKGITLKSFYSEVIPKGKKDMAWELSSTGFQMTLSGYIPDLIGEDIEALVERAVLQQGMQREDIHEWCVHPGGKKILEAIEKSLSVPREAFANSYHVLRDYGNMSSATILFVLKDLYQHLSHQGSQLGSQDGSQLGSQDGSQLVTQDGSQLVTRQEDRNIFGMAFGPGLTMETFIGSV